MLWYFSLGQYTVAFYSYRCPNSMGSDESRIPTLCLVCGEMLCSGSFCCQVEINKPSSPRHNMIGAASAHMQKCGAGSGIFLRYVSFEQSHLSKTFIHSWIFSYKSMQFIPLRNKRMYQRIFWEHFDNPNVCRIFIQLLKQWITEWRSLCFDPLSCC